MQVNNIAVKRLKVGVTFDSVEREEECEVALVASATRAQMEEILKVGVGRSWAVDLTAEPEDA